MIDYGKYKIHHCRECGKYYPIMEVINDVVYCIKCGQQAEENYQQSLNKRYDKYDRYNSEEK